MADEQISPPAFFQFPIAQANGMIFKGKRRIENQFLKEGI